MFIVPIAQMPTIDSLKSSGLNNIKNSTFGEEQDSSVNGLSPFKTLFQEAIGNVKSTDAAVQNEIYKLSTGQTDNLTDVTIASTKASMSVDLLVQLRNKALDAYNQVLSTSL